MQDGGTGSVALAVEKEDGPLCRSITSVRMAMGSGGDAAEISADFAGSAALLSAGRVDSGAHPAVISFLAGADVLYSVREVVNIFDGLPTDSWLKSGGEPYLCEKSDGTVRLLVAERLLEAAAAIRENSASTFFVSGAGGYDSARIPGGSAPADSNSGSYEAPFATVYAASARCVPDGRRWTIYVDGTTAEPQAVTIAAGADVSIVPLSAAEITPARDFSPALITVEGTLSMSRISLDGGGRKMHAVKCGGALDGPEGGLLLDSCEIVGFGDSAVKTSSACRLADCKIESCSSASSGGAIYSEGMLAVSGGTISGCTAYDSGGAIYASGALYITDVEISSCAATSLEGKGGGIFATGGPSGGPFELSGGSISQCESGYGGAVHVEGLDAVVSGARICRNKASSSGGGISAFFGTRLRADGVVMERNSCGMNGGAVFIVPGISARFDGCVIEGAAGAFDFDAQRGGGIYCAGAGGADSVVAVSDCAIIGCGASVMGGALYIEADVALADTVVSGCTSRVGAGIAFKTSSGGTLSVSGCTQLDSASGVNISSPGSGIISVSGRLTAPGKVAAITFNTIQPEDEGMAVIADGYSGGAGGTFSEDVAKFVVENPGYMIDFAGKLRSAGRILDGAEPVGTVGIALPEGGMSMQD